MTLDPVHFEGIAQLAARLSGSVDAADHRDFAETVWTDFLDPLYDDEGVAVIEPLGDDGPRRRKAEMESVALEDDPFPTVHGLDSGTINPTTFRNGLVVDVAQAAMSATPSDLELHRSRTVVETVHASDAGADFDDGWTEWDGGHSQGRVLAAPRVSRYEEGVVHALALYLAESRHALDHAEEVSDLLVLDGPLYPKGMLQWASREPPLSDLLVEDERPQTVLANYLELVERFVEREVPLVGFVKNPAGKALTRTLRSRGRPAPWRDDAAFFAHNLERRERVDGEWRRATDHLTCTNWFVSRGGVDRPLSAAGDALGLERSLDSGAYAVTFFAVFDPRDGVVYRVEAPYAVTEDADVRERLTRHVLSAVAAERGPPLAVRKADQLARIGREEKASLRDRLEEALGVEQARTYDDLRWDEDIF